MKTRIDIVEFDKPKTRFPRQKIIDIINGIARIEIPGKSFYLAIIIANNERTRKLNRKYRKKNKIASVLSFPISSGKDIFPNSGILVLGDIILNIDKINKEAGELEDKISFNLAHAFLHLLGYDHSTRKNELKMEKEEKKLEGVFNEKND